ncbi:MAG: phosphoglucosamine mutase [Clostridiales Family XIII bacterium]|jgi:phosphoglucosamine mutase|nr:phosphoglucosamine mutase [Clostridiales Family XIII bacterium]
MGRFFGTDGVRGIANKELTGELAYALGVAAGYVLGKQVKGKKPSVLIGKDTRISGDMLEAAIGAGLLSMGCDIMRAGVLPTPGIAYLTRKTEATAGVVISASHNTFEYNGIKLFDTNGFKLADTLEDMIAEIVTKGEDVNSHITGALLGRAGIFADEALKTYVSFLSGSVREDLSSLRVVVDCANGAACKAARQVFSHLGVQAVYMGSKPDGTNINDARGSTHPEAMQKRVVREQADVGLAFDGDADRLICADETGALIDGDKLMYICAKAMKESGKLAGNLLTATVMSNHGFAEALAREGIELQRADVGDRYVIELMRRTGSAFGGEQSGHLIFLDENTTGDGIFAALRFLEALRRSGRKASGLAGEVTIYPQVLKNAKVKNENKYSYDKDEKIAAAICETEKELGGNGRVLIRPSGTEPLVRVMLEGQDKMDLGHMADRLVRLIEIRLR